MTDTNIVEVSVHIAALPETVFPYFTDPARFVRWMGSDATLEATPGGIYRVRMRDGVQTEGEFVEVEPPRRLVFTWGWTGDGEVPPGASRVVITLEPRDGGTQVVLRHHGLPDGQRDHHRAGWDMYIGRLVTCLAGGDPGPDPNSSPEGGQ
ncbi:MAG: SRPBCC domain-containing protein [Actinomycetota bacterium]